MDFFYLLPFTLVMLQAADECSSLASVFPGVVRTQRTTESVDAVCSRAVLAAVARTLRHRSLEDGEAAAPVERYEKHQVED